MNAVTHLPSALRVASHPNFHTETGHDGSHTVNGRMGGGRWRHSQSPKQPGALIVGESVGKSS